MATTRLIPMHINKGKTIAQCLTDRTDYSKNPAKTNGGELVSAYECDPEIVDAQFLLSKREYKANTGRDQESNIIAYQIRQSFKPGEVSPEEANRIGYDLATRWTKGRYAFIVATHVDKAHIHNHIIYNSTSLDCSRKFRNFWNSSYAIRRISDRLCLESGLTIIEESKKSKSSYGKWLGDELKPSFQEMLRRAIDATLDKKPADYSAFLKLMQEAGYEYKTGKQASFRTAGQKRFTRLRSLGEAYSEEEIRAVISGLKPIKGRKKTAYRTPQRINLVLDIQAKLQAGKGAGYERWAKVYNLKQMSQALNYLTEHNLLARDALEAKVSATVDRFHLLGAQIKADEARLAEIAKLETHIINYSKTRETYVAYRKAGYSKKFYNEHTADLLLHKAAKDFFDETKLKKLPTVKALKVEYAELLTEKKKEYAEYVTVRAEMKEVLTVKGNVDALLGKDHAEQERENERDQR